MIDNKPRILTAQNAAIVDGGGVIVATLPDYQRTNKTIGDPSEWRFSPNTKPTINHIAPGLDVFVTNAPTTLEDAAHTALVSVKRAKLVRGEADIRIAAPPIESVTRAARRNLKHPFSMTTATLTADAPTNVVALIVFDSAGRARSWGQVIAGTRAVTVYTSGGCAMLPDGTKDTAVGDRVRLGWLDSSGRLGKLSLAIEVTAAAEPRNQ